MVIRIFKLPFFVPWFLTKTKWNLKARNTVFLTFDDGPHPEITPWLLSFAKENDIPLTFFWLGENAEKNIDLIERAKKEGHVVANHGYEHLNSSKTDNEKYFNNYQKGKAIVPDNLFRPPYGKIKPSVRKIIAKHTPIIMWTRLSYDWDKKVSDQKIINKLTKGLIGGEILVFHENDKTKDRIKTLLPKVVEVIQEKGFNFAKIEL